MFKSVFRRGPDSLITNLQQKMREWGSVRISARIVVPPDLKWWYIQEFGSAIGGRTRQVDETGGASGETYEIHPINNTVLSFPGPGGEQVTVPYVKKHPGVPSHHFVTRTLPENLQIAEIKFIAAMDRSGWNVQTVKDSLIGETMPLVKQNIVQMIEITLPGTRSDGKLSGATAAEAFESSATIVDSSL